MIMLNGFDDGVFSGKNQKIFNPYFGDSKIHVRSVKNVRKFL